MFQTLIIKRKGWLLVALLCVAVLAGACGGGTSNGGGMDGDGNQQQGQQQGGAGQEIDVDSGEFYFRPSDITARRGEPVTLVVKNSGQIPHNISIDEFNVDRDYNAGQTIRVTFTPNQAGEFKLYCDIPGHEASGMVGTLTVQ